MTISDAKLNRDKLIGIYFVVVVPAIIIVSEIFYFLTSLFLGTLVISLLALVYVALLSDKVDYGPKQIRRVRIPQIREDLEELLKTTTYSGELIFVYLISVFEDNERLSQTELVNRVKGKYESSLTHQSIRKYIIQLERHGLIQSPSTPREREYRLTEQGRRCSKAVKVCFPKTYFWFIVRHFLKIRKLSEFPQNETRNP